MPIQIDWINELLLITSPTTEVDLQSLHDLVEDERGMASPVGLIRSAIFQPEGKIEDPTNPGVFSQIILVMNTPWQIQFWGGSGYTRVYGGKIVGGLSDQPIKATGTAGDITVLEAPVDGVYVSGAESVPTAEEVADAVWDEPKATHVAIGSFGEEVQEHALSTEIADNVWDELTATHTDSGSFGEAVINMLADLGRALGLMQENYYLDQTTYGTYDGQKQLTSGRIRVYSDPASVGTGSDVIATYAITASWTGAEMDTYSVVKQ